MFFKNRGPEYSKLEIVAFKTCNIAQLLNTVSRNNRLIQSDKNLS